MPKSNMPLGLRAQVYNRDDWKCRHCGNRQTLDPHHVIYRSAGGENAANNLLTLCRKCHDDIHAERLGIEVVEVLPTNLLVKFWRLKGWKP
jgi:5-methylcytosine-specific restriction endonuclease McrA